MVSNPKRMRYVSENESSSSDGEGSDVINHQNEKTKNILSEKRSRKGGKWLSKNAIMARENRLRKKLYITNLEKEVSQLKTEKDDFSKVIESQSLLITDLKKEVKYLKSVIANSKDISRLIRNIQHNTGMSVTTSLEQSLSMNDYVSKPKQLIARKTAHPWEESHYPNLPTPESDLFSSPDSEFNNELLNNLELDEVLGDTDFIVPINVEDSMNNHLKEHNYTSINENSDVGVCLHVSKHRVSLEFCSTCSDNASAAWND